MHEFRSSGLRPPVVACGVEIAEKNVALARRTCFPALTAKELGVSSLLTVAPVTK